MKDLAQKIGVVVAALAPVLRGGSLGDEQFRVLVAARTGHLAKVHRASCAAHRSDDRGLGKLFDAQFARSFIEEVLFPDRTPTW